MSDEELRHRVASIPDKVGNTIGLDAADQIIPIVREATLREVIELWDYMLEQGAFSDLSVVTANFRRKLEALKQGKMEGKWLG